MLLPHSTKLNDSHTGAQFLFRNNYGGESQPFSFCEMLFSGRTFDDALEGIRDVKELETIQQ